MTRLESALQALALATFGAMALLVTVLAFTMLACH